MRGLRAIEHLRLQTRDHAQREQHALILTMGGVAWVVGHRDWMARLLYGWHRDGMASGLDGASGLDWNDWRRWHLNHRRNVCSPLPKELALGDRASSCSFSSIGLACLSTFLRSTVHTTTTNPERPTCRQQIPRLIWAMRSTLTPWARPFNDGGRWGQWSWHPSEARAAHQSR